MPIAVAPSPYHLVMPRRTTLLQRIVFVAKRNLADTDAVVTESKMLRIWMTDSPARLTS